MAAKAIGDEGEICLRKSGAVPYGDKGCAIRVLDRKNNRDTGGSEFPASSESNGRQF